MPLDMWNVLWEFITLILGIPLFERSIPSGGLERLSHGLHKFHFMSLDTAGFDTTKAQGTILGRLVKVTFLVAPVVASILTILNLLGWLKLVKAALGISAE